MGLARIHSVDVLGVVIATFESATRDGPGDAEGGTRSPGAGRPPLSTGLIVRTAIGLIETGGLSGLTMRRLGQALGVEAMSLYRYVPGREALLDEVVDHLILEVRDDPEVLDAPRDGWRDFLERMAHGVRRVALRHPRSFPLVSSRPPEAPWLRPPLRSVEWVEMFLDGLIREGFGDRAAVGAYRGFSSFLLGHLLLEVSAHGAEVGPLDAEREDTARASNGSLALGDFPTVARLRAVLSSDEALSEFEQSLDNLLTRIDLMRAEDADR